MEHRRVLLIDDEDDIREIAQLSLEMVAQWDVLTARSGREGIACAAAEHPDAILLDVMMPDLDGPATLRSLREVPSTREIPVVFVTAKPKACDPGTFNALGVRGVIAKPFDPMQLSKQVSEHLGWPA